MINRLLLILLLLLLLLLLFCLFTDTLCLLDVLLCWIAPTLLAIGLLRSRLFLVEPF